MGFFSDLFGRSEERKITTEDVPWTDFGHGGPAITVGSVDAALRLAPLFAATRLISDSIASLPLDGYRLVQGERQPLPTPSLFASPTIYGGVYEWTQRALTSLLLKGNAYGYITSFDANGYPAAIEWLHPDDVTLSDDRTAGRPQWYWQGRPVDPWLGRNSSGELLHIPWYTLPGQVLGLSPIAAFRSTVELGLYSQRFGSDFFRNGAIPSGTLETDRDLPTPEDAAIVKARFKAAASGRDIAVLGSGLKFSPITVPPEESQFLLTQENVATTVAAIYGVPPEMVGGKAGGSLTYSSPEQNNLQLIQHTLRPVATKLEAAFSSLLPRPQYVRFNFGALLRSDTKTRYEAHALAISNGFMSVDEVRALEELPPLEQPTPQQAEPSGEPELND